MMYMYLFITLNHLTHICILNCMINQHGMHVKLTEARYNATTNIRVRPFNFKGMKDKKYDKVTYKLYHIMLYRTRNVSGDRH